MPEKRPKKGLFQAKDSKSHYSNAYSGDLLLPEHISLLFPLNIGIGLPNKHALLGLSAVELREKPNH